MCASAQEPVDFTQSSFRTLESCKTASLTIENPCLMTQVESFTIENMMTYIAGGEIITSNLPIVQDSASQTYGNTDGLSYCGDRQYEFANPELVPTFISIQGQEIVIQTIDDD